MAMLPTGKVLIFSAEHGVPGIHAWTLDPKTLLKKNVKPPAGWNLDCAGHAFFSDGRLLVSGGTLSFKPLRGSKRAYLFDPWTETAVGEEIVVGSRWRIVDTPPQNEQAKRMGAQVLVVQPAE